MNSITQPPIKISKLVYCFIVVISDNIFTFVFSTEINAENFYYSFIYISERMEIKRITHTANPLMVYLLCPFDKSPSYVYCAISSFILSIFIISFLFLYFYISGSPLSLLIGIICALF